MTGCTLRRRTLVTFWSALQTPCYRDLIDLCISTIEAVYILVLFTVLTTCEMNMCSSVHGTALSCEIINESGSGVNARRKDIDGFEIGIRLSLFFDIFHN